MNMNSIFRLKFAYKGEKDNGKIVKKKLEVLAMCVNYTDAEKLAVLLAKNNGMDTFETHEYEIVLTKLSLSNILVNNTLENDGTKVNDLVELFFSGAQDGLFLIKAKFFAKSDDDKDTTEDYLVPGATINEAVTYLKKYLINGCGNMPNDFTISSSKIDNAENLYLTESVYNNKIAKEF